MRLHKKWIVLFVVTVVFSLIVVASPAAAHAAVKPHSHLHFLPRPADVNPLVPGNCSPATMASASKTYNMYHGQYKILVFLEEYYYTSNNSYCGWVYSYASLSISSTATCSAYLQSAVGVAGFGGLISLKGWGTPIFVGVGDIGFSRSQDIQVSAGTGILGYAQADVQNTNYPADTNEVNAG